PYRRGERAADHIWRRIRSPPRGSPDKRRNARPSPRHNPRRSASAIPLSRHASEGWHDGYGKGIGRRQQVFFLYLKPEHPNVAGLGQIVLAFGAELAGVARRGLAAERHIVLIGHRFGADEAAFEIAVDRARRLRRPGALLDGPGARLLRADGEEGDQVEQLVT